MFVITFLLVLVAQTRFGTSISICAEDLDCSLLQGSVCRSGDCVCPTGTEPVDGGTVCGDIAPYHNSPCTEVFQCSRLITRFQCLKNEGSEEGKCVCQPGFHYFMGRCWQSSGYGESCSRDEECLGIIRDPLSLSCVEGSCACAEGYYSRQPGECRKIANAVGERCVVNADCQFPNGTCDVATFSCYSHLEPVAPAHNEVQHKMAALHKMANVTKNVAGRQLNQECDAANPCAEDFDCHSGACVCKRGYYTEGNTGICYAELGSPSTGEQCVGLLAEVFDGVCMCPNNFYFEDNMRDCIKVTRFITDSCVHDENCHTFGIASVCGPPQEPWFLRNCECDPAQSVWDSELNMCRFFSGIGESCEVDSDCLAGNLPIQCLASDEGQLQCTCPEGYDAVDGLCLTVGLGLNDECQASSECTATEHTVCDGRCVCGAGFQAVDDFCAPVIGGTCSLNEDCLINNTVCANVTGVSTCQCDTGYVGFEDVCWPSAEGYQEHCNVTAQCIDLLGDDSVCQNNICQCNAGHHYRDARCWPMTDIFQSCSRTSECYLAQRSEMLVCRNGICQCDFTYPYDEELGTCTSSASIVRSSLMGLLFLIGYYGIIN